MTRIFFRDLLERVLATFLETVAGALVALQVTASATGVAINGLHVLEATAAGAGVAAGVALLKGIAASLRGDPNSASLSAAVAAVPPAAPLPVASNPPTPAPPPAPPAVPAPAAPAPTAAVPVTDAPPVS